MERTLANGDDIRIALVFPTFGGLSVGSGWQDVKLSVEHLTHWKKIALVTDVEWMIHLVRLFGWMTPGELRHFPSTSATRPWTGLRPTEPVPAAIRGLTDLGRFGSGSQRLRIRDAGYGGHDGGIKIVSHSSTVTDEEDLVATTGRVLLVGKRERVLDRLAEALRAEGLHVREETDFHRVRTHVDGSTVDVLALGRAVTGARREGLVAALRARNPAIRVVDGLAPITPLLVAQVQEALTTPGVDSRIVAAAGVEIADRSVAISLRRPADVTVVYHRLDALYRAHEQQLHSGPLGRGTHWFPVKGTVTRGERFLVVRADGQTSVHQLV